MSTEQKYAVGVDIGGSHITSAVIDLELGQIVGHPVTTDVDHTSPAEVIFSAWTKNLRLLMNEAGMPVKQIGMAFPGPFDYDKGISYMEHKFASIYGINVGVTLAARLLDFPGLEFKFVNDAGAFALGESSFGAAKDDSRVIVLTLGTGVGSGFVANHTIVRSGDSVPPGGEVWNLPFRDGIVDEAFSTRWVVGRYQELTGKQVQGAKDVAMRFEFDEAAKQLFTEFGYRLAEFTTPWLNKFDSRTLVLGGNISRSLPLFMQPLQRAYGQAGLTVSIKGSVLLDKAAMLGAASLFL
ncbi:MAG: ROK family protein [Bacteroidales bacterium]|nr:ROK family protein [Bacteroidales bacterium]